VISPLRDQEDSVENYKQRDSVIENSGYEGSSTANQIDEDQLRKMNAARRVAEWTGETMRNQEMIMALKDGIYGKNGHIARHRFRRVDKTKHLSDKPVVNRK